MSAALKIVEDPVLNERPLGIVSEFVSASRGNYFAAYDLADKLIEHHLEVGMAEVENLIQSTPEGLEAGREVLAILQGMNPHGYFANALAPKVMARYQGMVQNAATPMPR